MLPPAQIMVLLRFREALKSICNPKRYITRIGGSRRLLSPFEGTGKLHRISLEGKALGFPHGWLKIFGSPACPDYD